ncbi:hypothetical protein [Sciscionella marina]|uniref:hypothetical protein n=1 Tax=Sciscionella marina TaxID=508770 RepID=UPI00036345FC|nr:hypothetical protein [Sciscionella marina]
MIAGAVLAEDGGDIMAHLFQDYLIKAGIVIGLAVLVLIAMVIIWKKVSSRK